MLTIRKEQMDRLEAHMSGRFRQELLQRLRSDLKEECRFRANDELLALIEEGIQRSRDYDITIERDIILYVYLMVLHGPHFEEAREMAWAKKILLKRDMAGEAKMSLIYQMLAARQAPTPAS